MTPSPYSPAVPLRTLTRTACGLIAAAFVFFSTQSLAYTGEEMLADCQAAEAFYREKPTANPYQSMRGTRCMAYIAGFVDSYAISQYLTDKIGVQLNAFCLPPDNDLTYRLVRAVLAHLEYRPPGSNTSTATLVAGALAKTFPCPEVPAK